MGNNCSSCTTGSCTIGEHHVVGLTRGTHGASPSTGGISLDDALPGAQHNSPGGVRDKQERSALDGKILDSTALLKQNKCHIQRLAGGLAAFALQLYRQISIDSDDNVFVSPFSLYVAMAMTYLGARGNTRQQMKSGLGFEDMEDDEVHESMFAIISSLKNTGGEYMIQMANRCMRRSHIRSSTSISV